MVAFLEGKGGAAYVGAGTTRVLVGVVRPDTGAPYLRTYADGKWTNNLVNLPTF
jgi:exosome complex RNA-binding protein Rrp42 (RNase PH superfamily)